MELRGDLARAEEMYRKALALYAEVGAASDGMASTTGNLGFLYEDKGDLDTACAHWRKARDLWREIGNAGEVEKYEGGLRKADFFGK